MKLAVLPATEQLLPPLWAHQERAEEYALPRSQYGLLMRMRLGKTRVAIRRVKRRRDIGLIHVLLPSVAVEAWTKWLALEGEYFVVVVGLNRSRRIRALQSTKAASEHRRVWVLINYECLDSTPEIRNYLPDEVIADESTHLKNPAAGVTKAANRNYPMTIEDRGILTGMLRPESDLDVFSQIKFAQGQFMGCSNFYQWRHRHFQMVGHNWFPRVGASRRIREAVQEFAHHCSHADAGIDIPRVYEPRIVPMNAEQRRLQKQVLKEFAATLASGERMETNWVVVRELWLRRIAGGLSPDGETLISTAKLDDLVTLLRGEMIDERVVVFFAYREELAQAHVYLTERKIQTGVLWGGMKPAEEAQIMKAFRERSARCLLATIEKAQFSLDCSVASAEYYYSNVWSAEARAQSEERIMHVEREDPVLILDAITEGSVDERLVPRLHDKTFDARTFLVDFVETWSRN